MHTGDVRLWDIRDKAGASSHLSAEELAYAEEHLKSSLPGDRSNACEAILRCSKSHAQRSAAVKVLEELCLNSAGEDYVLTLLTALSFARTDVFSNPVGICRFVMRQGRSPKHYLRVDAALAVGVLAKAGNREALELLRSLARDDNEDVRGNALIYLRKIGE